jgi:lipoprotein NlpD
MVARLAVSFVVMLLVAACGSGSSWRDQPDQHIVRRGETLFSIAWRYGKDPADVARWNNLGDGSLIYPGQVIRLTPPSGRTSTSRQASKKQPLPNIPAQPPPAWTWPTSGHISVEFGGKPGSGTGVLINGKAGQAIVAAASGRVVYAGGGLIGYGQLIILKHNDTYLSAYGYKGQRIATMGEGPERKPRLHFEIRRNGKPVNPRQYLPAR